jgi:hypothetical protein
LVTKADQRFSGGITIAKIGITKYTICKMGDDLELRNPSAAEA